MTDGELLRRYVRDQSESAFAELTTRHINLVYSSALRQVNGNAHLAEDVTQSVFADLARKAGRLVSHTSLAGWLYTSTRFLAANIRRTEQRRSVREQETHAMNAILSQPESQPDWSQLSPLLDAAMHKLDETDREAVLLRHFENYSFAEIGGKIGLTENAARMRVERALEKLHDILAKQGAAFTVVVLAGLLGANAVVAAPAHLAAKVVSGALAGVAAGGAASAFLSNSLAILKTKAVLVGTTAALLGILGFVYASHSPTTPENNSEKLAAVVATKAPTQESATSMPATNLPVVAGSKARVQDGLVLHLSLVTADGGKPIPNVPIEYWGWCGDKGEHKQIISNRFGECDVEYPTNTSKLELTTRKDGFADTRLLWLPSNGDVIPTNYVARIDWPVAIGGRVVDMAGKPVAGAEVWWNYIEDPVTRKLPQNHNFGSIVTTTDDQGKWHLNRIVAEMIPFIDGSASHSNYYACTIADNSRPLEKQLRDESLVFKLDRAGLTVTGIVVDGEGNPVPDAKILVGVISVTGSRTGQAQNDGTFAINGCQSGKQLVTAEANGFAATTVEANLENNSNPIRITLKPGKTLRIRVTDAFGTPIPNAFVVYDCLNNYGWPGSPMPVQVEFNCSTGPQGRVCLTNAPDTEMKLRVYATGFLHGEITVRPDDQEHTITLANALIVHGVVYDYSTGLRIPKFRIVQGWPQVNPLDGTTNLEWSSIDRFWLDFSGGTYTNTFQEGVVGGQQNPVFVLKFIADGYAPFVTRVISASEGNVELNVTMERADPVTVTVYKPDGRPAALADIGLVYPGARLNLIHDRFSTQSSSGGALLHTDANGTFILQPDDSVTRIIAVNQDGYGETTPAALLTNPTLRMRPWGRLEATTYSHGQPVGGREYGLSFADIPLTEISLNYNQFRVTSDSQGKITVEKLPPGRFTLVRHSAVSVTPESMSWMEGGKTQFEIRAGETTTLDLGTSNYIVTAHLVWPAGMQRQSNWSVSGTFHTPLPEMTSEMATNPAFAKERAQTIQQIRKAMFYPAAINKDDTIAVEDVAPGDYQLSVKVSDNSKAIAQSEAKLTVSADSPSGTIDLGAVEMKPVLVSP